MENFKKKPSKIISEFVIYGGKLITAVSLDTQNTNIYLFKLPEIVEIIQVNIKAQVGIIKVQHECFLYQDVDANLFQFELSDNFLLLDNLSREGWKVTLNNGYDSKYLICCRGRIFEREYGIYDIEEKKVIISGHKNLFGLNINNIVYINNKNSIECLLIEQDDIIWEFSFSDLAKQYSSFTQNFVLGEVWRFVEVVNGILWVDVNYIGKGGALLGLDAATGILVHFLNELVFQNEILSYLVEGLPLNSFTQHDKEKNILFGTDTYFYWEIDLSSPSHIKMWDFEEELKEYQASFARDIATYTTTKSHIFSITGRFGETFSSQVFAFNRETHKIDWQYNFNDLDVYIRPIKVEVSENKLYVLDSSGTLHIFEREK